MSLHLEQNNKSWTGCFRNQPSLSFKTTDRLKTQSIWRCSLFDLIQLLKTVTNCCHRLGKSAIGGGIKCQLSETPVRQPLLRVHLPNRHKAGKTKEWWKKEKGKRNTHTQLPIVTTYDLIWTSTIKIIIISLRGIDQTKSMEIGRGKDRGLSAHTGYIAATKMNAGVCGSGTMARECRAQPAGSGHFHELMQHLERE
jgi:hypothetical protein